ncbi:hypothetical protein HH214_07610 [Mucilaginibacter robiniae]|uniref:Uncharacterized protein n=1 Tax=Mucilaginibacter robiniae TaxID=2728022 RepID=A0A7L5E5W7_9SPHI|nr:hypothetical protein [Mucilaginibacter robiniae]QJD95746.1 hypothetical protein HH214_07610 [Mucilaginibacter robiniae]
MSEDNLNLQNETISLLQISRRRKLLPWWVLTFTWIFLVFGAAVPVIVVMGLLKFKFQISLLGLSTNNPLSITALFLILIYLYKGLVAFGLWTEKDWAIKTAKVDAILSIAICLFAMIYTWIIPQTAGMHNFSFRLELFIIIPYLLKMRQIQSAWESFDTKELQGDSAYLNN